MKLYYAACIVIGLCAVAATLLLAYAFSAKQAPPAPPATHWIYGPRTTAATGQKGVIVACQAKTNSRAFGAREHATPGDVYVMTCRAERG